MCEDMICVTREKKCDPAHDRKPMPPTAIPTSPVSNASTPEFPFKLCSWEQSPVSDLPSVDFELDISVVEERMTFPALLQKENNTNPQIT